MTLRIHLHLQKRDQDVAASHLRYLRAKELHWSASRGNSTLASCSGALLVYQHRSLHIIWYSGYCFETRPLARICLFASPEPASTQRHTPACTSLFTPCVTLGTSTDHFVCPCRQPPRLHNSWTKDMYVRTKPEHTSTALTTNGVAFVTLTSEERKKGQLQTLGGALAW